jgi:hypothetical protein
MGIDSANLLNGGMLYAERRGMTLRTGDRLRTGGGQNGQIRFTARSDTANLREE